MDYTAVTGFATAVARRYSSTGIQDGCTASAPNCHGVIQYYEEWNEINNWDCSGGQGWQDTFANDALQASWIYTAVKTVDPSAIVGAPNMAASVYEPATAPVYTGTTYYTVWLDAYLDAGGASYADAVGIHSYGINSVAYQGGGVYTTPALGCDHANDAIACAGEPLLNAYNQTRLVMAKYGLGDKPILHSEGGWGADLQNDCAAPNDLTGCLSLSDQPNYAARWLIVLASTWSDGLGVLAQWYGYDFDWSTLNGSTWPSDGGAAQSGNAAAAWSQAAGWVIGAHFSGQCAKASGSTVFTCDLTTPTGAREQIVFNDNAGATTGYTVPSWAGHQTPLLGAAAPIAGGSTLTLGNAPVLLAP